MGKRSVEKTEEEIEAEALAAKKAAKKAKKAAAAAAAAAEEEEDQEDAEAAALAAKKAAKKAKKAAEAAAAEAEAEEEDPEAAERAAKKAAKKAKKAAAAAAAAEEEEAGDEEPAPKKKKDDVTPNGRAEEEVSADKGKGKGKGNREFEVFIGGLPFSTTEDVLRKDFEECGRIVNFKMPYNDEGNCRGIAFCEYADKESVEKALKFHETEYGGRYLMVKMSGDDSKGKGKGKDKGKDGKGKGKGNKEFEIFIGGLPFAATEDALKKDFAECGEIVNFRMPLNDEGNCRGIAFCEYADKESVEKALKFHETEYGGRYLSVKMSGDDSKGKGKDGKGKGKGNREFEIFIGGLPFATTEDALKKDFAECGEIVNFRMPLNDEGNARGIAFIEYKDKEACEKALKFHETDYGGRTLSVKMSGDGGGKGDKGKGKGKGKKGKATSEAKAKNTGCIVAGAGEKKTFSDSESE